MKFFSKLFLCTVLVLTVALSVTEYYTVSSSLDNAVEHQVENGLQQHQLVKYALQSAILTAGQEENIDNRTLSALAKQTAEAMAVCLFLTSSEGEVLYANMDSSMAETVLTEMDVSEGSIFYKIREIPASSGAARFLFLTSSFTQNGFRLELMTQQDITSVFSEAENLQHRCQIVFLLAAVISSLLMLLFSCLLTRPIKQLDDASRAFAEGNYTKRLTSRSHDEIGDLTRTYNQMADTIESKIEALELAVQQREDFVANFAHELKTPMTSIIGYADTLYQRPLSPAQVHKAAGYIVNEGMRLEALSFKLLELITLNRQDFLLEEMNLSELFQDVKESIYPSAVKREVQLEFHCEPGYARIEFDLFKTLLLNLLDNALKSGGNQVRLEGWAEEDRYHIAVTDNGRGIPSDQLQRITEAFYMVDKSRSHKEHGAGLGLALSARIAAIHGTSLRYASAEGQGTSVELTLALCQETDTEEE